MAWTPTTVTTDEPYYVARARLVTEFERHYLIEVLTQAGGNMSRAARTAGVDRTTLYRLLARHGLDHRMLTATAPQNGNGAAAENGNGTGDRAAE